MSEGCLMFRFEKAAIETLYKAMTNQNDFVLVTGGPRYKETGGQCFAEFFVQAEVVPVVSAMGVNNVIVEGCPVPPCNPTLNFLNESYNCNDKIQVLLKSNNLI